MSIHLELYRVFYYVALLGGVTPAAKELYLSQPAVSQAVRQLETGLRCALFRRTSRGMQLTREGAELYDFVSRGYRLILDGERRLREMNSLEYGEIRIGASDMTLEFFLLPKLQRFHQQYPGIRLAITNGPTPDTVSALQEGTIDFGVVSSPVSAPGLTVRPVLEIQDVFVAGSRFSYLRGCTLSPQELCALPLVCLERNTSTRRYLDGFFTGQAGVLAPEIELANSHLILQFALRNLGVGSVVRHFAQPLLADGRLFALNLDPAPPPRSICLPTDERSPCSAAAQALLDLLV